MANFSESCTRPGDVQYQNFVKAVFPYRERFVKNEYDIILLPNGDIGIVGKITVDAGSDSLLDNREQIVIGVQSTDFEHCSPYVFPDRLSFPFEYFPHINYPNNQVPATLCLTREEFGEWYAEHTFYDYLSLIKEWFDDAAKGNLIKLNDGDYFEPFRQHNPTKIFFRVPYEDSYIENCVVRNTLYFSLKRPDENCNEVFYGDITKCDFQDCYGIGMLFVKPATEICDKWFVEYPKTIKDLLKFIISNNFEWNIDELVKRLSKETVTPEILVFQLAFVRPAIVIGKHTHIDYLTFSIKMKDLKENNQEGPVEEVCVIDSLVPDFSNYLSYTSKEMAQKKILILGCGAIGSKLIYHFYRCGICDLTICDSDVIQPHNICRHSVVSYRFLSKKVDSIKKELHSMYPRVLLPLKTIDQDAVEWLPNQDLSVYDLIIDATASSNVMRCLDSLRNKIKAPIVSFALSEGGNVGHIYVNNHNSTLNADFYMLLLRESIVNDDLSNWLNKEKKYSLDYVRIGEGCHSNTMVLGDDIVSVHSALASQTLRNIDGIEGNYAFFSFLGDSYAGEIFSDEYQLDDMVSIPCDNAMDWEIRIPSILLSILRQRTQSASPKETGGYLMGCIEEKYRRIYILHSYIPKSSYQSRTLLRLSTKGWKEEHERVKKRTANNLIYIGDWHSHPVGTLDRSATDILTSYTITIDEIESKFGVCIITNTKYTKAYLLNPNVEIERNKDIITIRECL